MKSGLKANIFHTLYIIRLDDASDYMDTEKWTRLELIFDKYNIKPLVGVIPNNQYPGFTDAYQQDLNFWDKVRLWEKKGWHIAVHGYTHVYAGKDSQGKPTEFAGFAFEEQAQKLSAASKVFSEQGLHPKIFFAPSHTFDFITLEALKTSTDIRIVSDTIANDVYYRDGIYFIPVQGTIVRNSPFKVTTFCYHPNNMTPHDFERTEEFLKNNADKFIDISNLPLKNRSYSLYDMILAFSYKYIFLTSVKIRQKWISSKGA